jgi:hypothetical protein
MKMLELAGRNACVVSFQPFQRQDCLRAGSAWQVEWLVPVLVASEPSSHQSVDAQLLHFYIVSLINGLYYIAMQHCVLHAGSADGNPDIGMIALQTESEIRTTSVRLIEMICYGVTVRHLKFDRIRGCIISFSFYHDKHL